MTTMTTPEPTLSQSSPDPVPSLHSPTSARSPMLRPRPRLPNGPRTRKETQRHPAKDSQHPHFDHVPLPSSEAPGHPQDESFSLRHQASPSPDTFHPDASQFTSLPSDTPLPPAHHPVSMPIPITIPSRPSTPTRLASLPSSLASPILRKPSLATVSSPIAALTLPSAQIDLSPEPLPYRLLTLDAAHWTLTSTELQQLVSSAIRQSAKEQSIRLLPPCTIDTRMPEDAENIERSWEAAATRWRFEAHRRNMLLRALSASGADGDLLSQLSGTLSNIDSHAQDLLHAAAHRTQLAAARDTHRASALAVALRKLNASYARRTRDLDKARAHIALLRSEVDEAWKVAEEQAAEVDKVKVAARATIEPQEQTTLSLGDSVIDDEDIGEDDTNSNALHDSASADLTMISGAEVVDVTGKAIAAQARFTVMQTNHHSASRPPHSAYGILSPSSPVMSGSDMLQRQSSMTSQVSRVSAARKRSRRKSKASLRLPAPISVRSRSNVRGECGPRHTRSKSRNKKGKEPAQTEPPVPGVPEMLEGSFLEMEGRAAGDGVDDGQAGSDGDNYDVGDRSAGEESVPESSQAAESAHRSPLFALTSAPNTRTLSMQNPTTSQSPTSPLPQDHDTPRTVVSPPGSVSAQEQPSQHSSSSSPTSAVPLATSTPTTPPPESSGSHHQPQPSQSQHSDTGAGGQVAREFDLIRDPASMFTAIASSESTATTATSAPNLPRRGHSLELPSPSANSSDNQHAGGSKIRRSISEFLHFGNGSRTRRRSVPLPFKGRGWALGSDALASAIRQDLREEPHGDDGLENGWEEVLKGEA